VLAPVPVTSSIPVRPAHPVGAPARTFSGPRKGKALRGLPWGFELSAFWDRQIWGERNEFIYHYPAQVTIRSVGPAAAPAVAVFTMSLDPQIVADLRPTFLRLNNKERRGSVTRVKTTRTKSVFETVWKTPFRLSASDVLEVGFTTSVLKPAGALETIKFPVISVGPMALDPRQRDTGKDTITRLDHVWSER
jgi:hypothetical protein